MVYKCSYCGLPKRVNGKPHKCKAEISMLMQRGGVGQLNYNLTKWNKPPQPSIQKTSTKASKLEDAWKEILSNTSSMPEELRDLFNPEELRDLFHNLPPLFPDPPPDEQSNDDNINLDELLQLVSE